MAGPPAILIRQVKGATDGTRIKHGRQDIAKGECDGFGASADYGAEYRCCVRGLSSVELLLFESVFRLCFIRGQFEEVIYQGPRIKIRPYVARYHERSQGDADRMAHRLVATRPGQNWPGHPRIRIDR